MSKFKAGQLVETTTALNQDYLTIGYKEIKELLYCKDGSNTVTYEHLKRQFLEKGIIGLCVIGDDDTRTDLFKRRPIVLINNQFFLMNRFTILQI